MKGLGVLLLDDLTFYEHNLTSIGSLMRVADCVHPMSYNKITPKYFTQLFCVTEAKLTLCTEIYRGVSAAKSNSLNPITARNPPRNWV